MIRERVGQPVQWTQVVYGLCDYMHEHQILNAPKVVVEEWSSDTSAMVSENVLVLQTSDTHSSTRDSLTTLLPGVSLEVPKACYTCW